MTTRRIFRYTIPDDGQEHTVRLTSEPLHVSTGQPIPQGAAHTGTCPRTRGLVLHLYRIPTQQATP